MFSNPGQYLGVTLQLVATNLPLISNRICDPICGACGNTKRRGDEVQGQKSGRGRQDRQAGSSAPRGGRACCYESVLVDVVIHCSLFSGSVFPTSPRFHYSKSGSRLKNSILSSFVTVDKPAFPVDDAHHVLGRAASSRASSA